MTETNLLKAIGSKTENGENFEVNTQKPLGMDPRKQDAVFDRSSRKEQISPQSSFEGVEASTISTNTTEHVARSTPVNTWPSLPQYHGLYYRVLVLLLLLALWRSLAFSISIQTASSFPINNAKVLSHSNFHCNSLLCYSASLSIRKPEGLFSALGPRTAPLFSPVIKKCSKDNLSFAWKKMSNGRRYDFMCSDAFTQDFADLASMGNAHGARAAYSCLEQCILDNDGCEGVLYLVDRPFERNCFFQHNDERPAFEAGERVSGAKWLKE